MHHPTTEQKKAARPFGGILRKAAAFAVAIPILAAPLAPALAATDHRSEKMDRYLQETMHRYGVVGMSVIVLENGEPVFKHAYGLASKELNVPASLDTVYQISSITKLFTNMVIYQLIEEGQMSLDAPIGDYVEGLPESWAQLDIRKLLSHTSGLPDFAEMDPFPPTTEALMSVLRDAPFQFEPGAGSRYNQTNYLLLKLAAENITGEAFTDLVRDRVLKPAKLDSAAFGAMYAVVPGRATSYRPSRDGIVLRGDFDWPDYMFSAAGLNISVTDLEIWMRRLLAGDIVKQSTLDAVWKPVKLSTGDVAHHSLGWEYDETEDFVGVGHGGAAMTDVRHFIAKKGDETVTVLFLTNGSHIFFQPRRVSEGLGEFVADGVQPAADKMTDELYHLLANGRVKDADRFYKSFKSDANTASTNTERAMNRLGYNFLELGRNEEAITVFELNVESYPDSGNAWDSLGEGYLAIGDLENAKTAYTRALELNPKNENARKILTKL